MIDQVGKRGRRVLGRLALWCLILTQTGCGAQTAPCGTFRFASTPDPASDLKATVDFSFTPDVCGVACTCDEVVYVQIVRVVDMDTGAFIAPNSEQGDRIVTGQAEATLNGWAIDRIDNRVWGYYGRRNDGSFVNVTIGSNTTAATLLDRPSVPPNTSFEAVSVPTCISAGATCLARALGAYYWMYAVDSAGTASDPFDEIAVTWMQTAFDRAVTEWNNDAAALGKNELPAMSPLP
jgi:hypothetical protein